MPTHVTVASALSSPPDNCEQPTLQSPTESIFSDDDDIWFEAREQLDGIDTPTSPKAFPPLTPAEERGGEGVLQHEPKVGQGELNPHSLQQPVTDLNNDGPLSDRDAPGTSVSEEFKDSDPSTNPGIKDDSALVEMESRDHVDYATDGQKVAATSESAESANLVEDGSRLVSTDLAASDKPADVYASADIDGVEEVYQAESLVRDLKMQQKMADSCEAEARYVEVCTGATTTSKESEAGNSEPEMSERRESDCVEPRESEPVPATLLGPTTVVTCDAITNTEPVDTSSQSTNTSTPEFSTQGVNTDPPPVVEEIGCNTMLNCFDVLQRAREMEELQLLKVEHQIAVGQMNEAKSQKMVAEQLTNIVQSDLAELRQQNLTETTKRLQLENELSDAKVSLFCLSSPSPPNRLSSLPLFQIELSQTIAQLKEKEERVQELEESLSGTSLLVGQLLASIVLRLSLSLSLSP